ncbi:hypothetical protein [Psychroflexus sp. ALD_RP9]|uniref:hypothetical protein n=1 Tax=Psychroflexus sp. ALD_RP9 TaxID=2777186 RepID=UPI001A8F22F8|nr:hypothetical protein [Psychroflexus sp. ALD_RP9]QSS96833.1 hypothetical protein IMZ30_10330 [Psychroflexus sp. ALD_RP9]
MKTNAIKKGRTTAIIAHLTIFGCIIALFMNQEPKYKFASFYNKQSLGIHLYFILFTYLVSGINSWIATSAFYLSYLLLWLYSFLGAVQYKYHLIPYIGDYFQKWFNKLG